MMQPQSWTGSPQAPPENRRAALITLLADEDASVYRAVRKTILSYGLKAAEWLRPCASDPDPRLRRRAQEILNYFARQEADIRFLAFCLKHGEEFDLESAAWLLATTIHAGICVEGYRAVLDGYTQELRSRLGDDTDAGRVLGVVNRFLFAELGFRGIAPVPEEPENACLNRVMDRRAGDAVSLTLFYLLLARRLPLPLTAISLPGQFLCRYQSSSDELYVDVFNSGRLLTRADCVHYLVRRDYGFPADFLSALSSRRILMRICGELHRSYLRLDDDAEATRVQRYLVALGA